MEIDIAKLEKIIRIDKKITYIYIILIVDIKRLDILFHFFGKLFKTEIISRHILMAGKK